MIPRLALLPLLGALVLSCKGDAPKATFHPATEPPVPPPATLTAEGTLRDPDVFWKKVREGGGATLAASPETAAGVLLAMAGADRSLAPFVAGSQPFQLALGDSPGGTAFALAMKIQDLDAARAALVDADTARYRGEELAGMVHLVPRGGASPHVAVALTWSGYLVVASAAADLATLGAYAARTLPTKAPAASSFELRMNPGALDRAGPKAAAFASSAIGMLVASLHRSVPPEVDATALAGCFKPSLQALGTEAGDLAEARVDVDAQDAEVRAVATLVPKPGSSGARQRLTAMHPSVAAPLLEAPRAALTALLWSDSAAQRADDAANPGGCVGHVLAPILGPGGEPKLAEALASWAKGRGDWQMASILASGPVAGLVARAPTASGDDVSRAVRDVTALAAQPSVQDAVKRLLPFRAQGVEPADVPGVGKASVLMFAPTQAPSRTEDAGATDNGLTPPGMAWLAGNREVDLGVGLSPRELLGMTHPTATLGSDPLAARAIKALGSDATVAAVLRPPGCCGGGRAGSGPMTFGWGRRGGNGWASLTAGDELVGLLVARATAP